MTRDLKSKVIRKVESRAKLGDMSLTYSIDEQFDLTKIETRFRKIFELALPFLQTRLNLPHTFIVYQYAQLLLKEEGGAAEVTLPACILHDVGWSSVPEDRQLTAFGPRMTDDALRRKHEVEGVAIAGQILRNLGYDEALIPEIIMIIDGHDTTREAKSSEDAITKDSDKLFRFSAFGFRSDCERFHEDPQSRFKLLLKKTDKWFLTRTGKEVAAREARERDQELREGRHFQWQQRGNPT
jgi:HD superfamily phosphodiesterase